MLRLRTKGPLAPVVASALVRGDSDATAVELLEVERSVHDSLGAMPDTLRFGVNGVSLLAEGALLVLGRADFRSQPTARRVGLARRLSALPLPGMAEFARLTRGLGLVSLYEGRDAAAASAPPEHRAR
jgi:hypothetical protein